MTGPLRCLILTVMLASLTGCAPHPTQEAARMGSAIVTIEELSAETRRQMALAGFDYDTSPPSRVYEMALMILTGMLDEKAAEQRAGPDLMSKARVRAERFNPTQGDPTTIRRDIYRALLIEEIAKRDHLHPPEPSDKDLQAIYDHDPARWSLPAETDVRVFVENLEAQARTARGRSACRQRVEQARAAKQHGMEMTVRHGHSQPQLDAMALRTPVGATSPVFQLGPGHAYIEVIAHRPAVPQSFAQCRDRMRRVTGDEWHRTYFVRLRQLWREESGAVVYLRHDTLRQPDKPNTPVTAAVLVVALGGGLLAVAWMRWRPSLDGRWLWATLAAGCAVRVWFWFVTPYHWLAYDWEEHLDYIGYVGTQGAIPDLAAGFMFSQPPLYYLMCVPFGLMTGDVFDPRVHQTIGLVLSWVTMWFGLDALAMLTGHIRNRWLVRLAWFGMAMHPSFVFLAARVNNDCLAVLWGFLMTWFLVRWWREGRTRDWVGAGVVTGLGLLTKSTAMLWVPVLGVCLLAKSNLTVRSRVRLGAMAVFILVAMAGWLMAWRVTGENQRDLAANVAWAGVDVPIHADPHIRTLVTFQPNRIWQQPYVHSLMPSLTRDNFWEYFLRTSWYGEFSYQRVPMALVRALALTGLLLLAAMACGAIHQLRLNWREALPMVVVLVVVLAGHIAYRQTVPMACSQDFRYSMILLLPGYYLLACAPRWTGWLVAGWSVLSVVFLGVVTFF
jgi:hypothetical protein